MKKEYKITPSYLYFNFLNITDLILSHYAVYILGIKELNPIMDYLMNINTSLWVFSKILVGLIAGHALYNVDTNKFKAVKNIILILLSLVVLSNIYAIITHL